MDTSKVNETAPMIVRVAQGSLMAGHGVQKLFGSFGEYFTWRHAPYGIFTLPAGEVVVVGGQRAAGVP